MVSMSVRLGLMGFVLSIAAAGMVQADDAPVAANLCFRTAADFQALAVDPTSRTEVVNRGGLANGGVCWWHSRLQRSALYLTMFRPDLPKPTHSQGIGIINTLANMSQVVVIPGYANFNEFSRDYENEIISRLESWQRSDGFLHFRWIDGLKGHSSLNSNVLHGIADRIYQMVAVEHQILFEKLHLPSITSHAYLFIGARQTSGGYDFDVIDSNYPTQTMTVHYQIGQTSMHKADNGENFIPYLDFGGDMGSINGAFQRYCGHAIQK